MSDSRERSRHHRPGAVGDEDALSDGQRAVVPDQQEVKEGVQSSETTSKGQKSV